MDNNIRLAFMFMVLQPENKRKFYIKIAKCIDYVCGRVGWMDDPLLPEFDDRSQTGTLVPDIDLTEECHEFDTEQEAIEFMAKHYESELKRVQNLNAG